ncbi:MAG: hypothetical protein ACRD4Q_11980 [Candidatus Acidiferrales bacterium]
MDTLLLKLAQFGHVLGALALEACFLELQIADLFFVGQERVDLDEGGALRRVVLFKLAGELNMAAAR